MRKIKQFDIVRDCIFALCEDGTMWARTIATHTWEQCPPIPKDDDPEQETTE